MQGLVFLISLGIVLLLVFAVRKKQPVLKTPLADITRQVLQAHVLFYKKLPPEEQARFERAVDRFLQQVKVTGVKTEVEDLDRVLVAAAAVIPIFGFHGWEYRNISEVLLYPGVFNKEYEQEGNDRNVLGMVGNGAMENVMILSRDSLRQGFMNKTDKHNTAIHEFVHLVDKADGDTDGVPEVLLNHQYALPWLKRIHKEIREIREGDSDINPYGATNEAEFFAVAAEYFFERPELMQQKHPALYNMLEQMFHPGHHSG